MGSPSIQVDTPGQRRSPPGPANGSRSSTTRSATAPGPRPRRRRRGGWPRPSPRCTPRTVSRARPARAGTARSPPGSPYDAVDRDVDRLERVGGADRPVAARTSRAPARCRSPKGYCHAARSSPRNGSVSSTIWSSWQAHSACMLAATPSSRTAARRRGAPPEVGDVVVAALVGAAPSNGVEGLAHRPVADGVHVHLEPGGVERGHRRAAGRRRRTSARCCRSGGRSGRGRAQSSRRCRSRRRRPA